jgi:O-antigen/teichoic acid export membrane protein
MTIWSSIAKALPLQLAGTISVALSMLLISRNYGPTVQGEFAYFKSLVEFFGPLVLLGAPQALLYFLRSGQIIQSTGVIISLSYAPITFIVTVLIIYFYRDILGGEISLSSSAFVLSICASFFGLTTNMRGVVLASGHHILFGIYSCLPQVTCLLLLIFIPLQRVGFISDFYVAGWILGAALALATAARTLRAEGLIFKLKPPRRLLSFLRYGLATYVPSICAAASAVATFSFIETSLGKAAVGNFSIVVMILQMVVMPVLLLAPSLFYSWTKDSDAEDDGADRNRQFGLINRYVIVFAFLCMLGQSLLLGPFVVDVVLGGGFQPVVLAASVLMYGYVPACLEAASIPLFLALGYPAAVAVAAAIKALVIIGAQALLWPLDLSGVAAIWAGAQWVGWLVLVGCLQVMGFCPISRMLGYLPARPSQSEMDGSTSR